GHAVRVGRFPCRSALRRRADHLRRPGAHRLRRPEPVREPGGGGLPDPGEGSRRRTDLLSARLTCHFGTTTAVRCWLPGQRFGGVTGPSWRRCDAGVAPCRGVLLATLCAGYSRPAVVRTARRLSSVGRAIHS